MRFLKFKIGDVCTLLKSTIPRLPAGSEVTVLDFTPDPAHPYLISSAGVNDIWCAEWALELKKPPDREDLRLSAWDKCIWRPRELVA